MSQLNRQIPRFSLVRARKTGANQNVNAGVEAIPAFNTEEVDRIGEYDPTTFIFTARKTGYYLIAGCLSVTIPFIENMMGVRLYTNGVFSFNTNTAFGATIGTVSIIYTFYIRLTAGQTAQVRYHNGSAGVHTIVAGANTYLFIKRVE